MPFEQAPRMGRAVCGSRLPWAAHCEDQAFVGAEMRLSRAAYTWSRACRVGLAICVGGGRGRANNGRARDEMRRSVRYPWGLEKFVRFVCKEYMLCNKELIKAPSTGRRGQTVPVIPN